MRSTIISMLLIQVIMLVLLVLLTDRPTGRSGLVVARLPAAREGPGSNRTTDKSLCFHENHCDTQLWARAAQ